GRCPRLAEPIVSPLRNRVPVIVHSSLILTARAGMEPLENGCLQECFLGETIVATVCMASSSLRRFIVSLMKLLFQGNVKEALGIWVLGWVGNHVRGEVNRNMVVNVALWEVLTTGRSPSSLPGGQPSPVTGRVGIHRRRGHHIPRPV